MKKTLKRRLTLIQNKEKLILFLLGLEKVEKKVEDLIIQAKSELEKISSKY